MNDNPSRDPWKQQPSGSAAATAAMHGNSTAFVYKHEDRIAVVEFSFRNQFGDWVNDAGYCFRPDGTLAQIRSRLDSFHSDMIVVRDYLFSDECRQIALERSDYALHTKTPKKPDPDFWDFPLPLYQRVGDLPFARVHR